MRSTPSRYPVDRYLVKSSDKFEMVSIIGDDIWNPEPALRPEDEIMLRKLHDMLQSTADDLKLLSGELSKFHEPGEQVKRAITPLDAEFNEKVHIEDVVNAKFYGHKLVENHRPEAKPRVDTIDGTKTNRTSKVLNTDIKTHTPLVTKRSDSNKKLGITRTRILHIDDNNHSSVKREKLNNGKILNNEPAVAYNEFSYKYNEPSSKEEKQLKQLQVQDMPSINIRSELKEQKVLQLDIVPEVKEAKESNTIKGNVSVVAVIHADEKPASRKEFDAIPLNVIRNQPVRKVSKLSTFESSGSSNNLDSDTKAMQKTQKRLMTSIRNSPKISVIERTKRAYLAKKDSEKRQRLNLNEWKRKLNAVYESRSLKNPKVRSTKTSPKNVTNSKRSTLNNAEYIPYSHLTVGGVRASDIEREISDLPNNTDVPLSPILDKILRGSSEKSHKKDPILNTSDENLLQEVIDIEQCVGNTLSKHFQKKNADPVTKSNNACIESRNNIEDNDSYADDFEDEKSDHSGKLGTIEASTEDEGDSKSVQIKYVDKNDDSIDREENFSIKTPQPGPSNFKNIFGRKSTSLSLKKSVDIFEFVHSVITHDTATQSIDKNKIIPKETQTSPRHDTSNIQPIHNDLWPSIDPRKEVEKMFELEKDFIKRLIVEEYGDLLAKNINKPATSQANSLETIKNVTSLQKNTQTSPAHVKSVMTSPRKTKSRTTSPFLLSVPVHQQTSPVVLTGEQHGAHQEMEVGDISVNLSSPRFSLRLPQTSREVLSNLREPTPRQSRISLRREINNKTFTKKSVSSSSVEDNSSSGMSSLGEVRMRKMIKKKESSSSECSSTSSTDSKYSTDLQSVGILPLRSEGEISVGQTFKKTVRSKAKSDGETSLGMN